MDPVPAAHLHQDLKKPKEIVNFNLALQSSCLYDLTSEHFNSMNRRLSMGALKQFFLLRFAISSSSRESEKTSGGDRSTQFQCYGPTKVEAAAGSKALVLAKFFRAKHTQAKHQ
jgi:hypothetical protein